MQSPLIINLPKHPDSRSDVSETEDEYNTEKLLLHEMYETKQPRLIGRHMANAEVVAFESVDRLLNDVSHIVYERYLSSKLNGHTIETTYDLVELLINNEFISSDKQNFVESADAEPPVVPIDNWGRSKIASKKLLKPECNNHSINYVNNLIARLDFNEGAESMISEDKKALQKAKDLGKKLIRDAKGENMPAPLDLQEPPEMNKTEGLEYSCSNLIHVDDLRQAKERERKRQEEERIADLQKRKAENQVKFKQGNVDLKKKPFTFDYNGVPIIINNAKVEKFPPAAYSVQHQIQDPESENQNNKKKKAAKEVTTVKAKQKRAPEAEQDFAKKYGLSVPTIDLLEPQVGVTYVENGKTKNSTKTRYNITSVTSGSLISTLGANPRLTKTEYAQLTRGGNLSRTNVGTAGDKENAGGTKQIDDKKVADTAKDQWTIKLGTAKEANFNTTGAMKMAQQYREGGKEIRCNQDKLEVLLKASEEIKMESMQAAKQDKRQEKFVTDDTLKRSPIDAFNLELLNSKDWGKNTYAGHVNSLPKLPTTQKTHLEQTLGVKQKYPRFRTSNVPAQKNYSELLMATIKSQQMA